MDRESACRVSTGSVEFAIKLRLEDSVQVKRAGGDAGGSGKVFDRCGAKSLLADQLTASTDQRVPHTGPYRLDLRRLSGFDLQCA